MSLVIKYLLIINIIVLFLVLVAVPVIGRFVNAEQELDGIPVIGGSSWSTSIFLKFGERTCFSLCPNTVGVVLAGVGCLFLLYAVFSMLRGASGT